MLTKFNLLTICTIVPVIGAFVNYTAYEYAPNLTNASAAITCAIIAGIFFVWLILESLRKL